MAHTERYIIERINGLPGFKVIVEFDGETNFWPAKLLSDALIMIKDLILQQDEVKNKVKQ
jgi:hypothetical protein